MEKLNIHLLLKINKLNGIKDILNNMNNPVFF